MLVAVLNTCTKEELEENEHEEHPVILHTSAEHAERRKIIKNKIMAVGRMARVFALLRYVVQLIFSSYFNFFFFWYLGKSQRRFQSSRVYSDHPSFHTELLHLVRRELEMRSMGLMMRALFSTHPSP